MTWWFCVQTMQVNGVQWLVYWKVIQFIFPRKWGKEAFPHIKNLGCSLLKEPALGRSIFHGRTLECPFVPVPKNKWDPPPPIRMQLQDTGHSTERWNNAAAGLCLSCCWGNYTAEIHTLVTGGSNIQRKLPDVQKNSPKMNFNSLTHKHVDGCERSEHLK